MGIVGFFQKSDLLVKRFLTKIVLLRMAVLCAACALPFSLPEIWRQSDTLGVTLRYWIKWTKEAHPQWPLLPSTLDMGNTTSLAAMEFPFLNLFSAPFYALGPIPGKFLSMLFVVLSVHALLWLAIRAFKKTALATSFDFNYLFLFAIASFSAGWTGKYMPDVLSVLLVLTGVGYGLQEKNGAWKAFIFSLVGILMKPTSIVVYGLLLLEFNMANKKKILRHLPWVFLSALLGVLYFTAGMKWVRSLGVNSGFSVSWRPFLASLLEALAEGPSIAKMLLYRSFFSLGFPLVLLTSVVYLFRGKHRGFILKLYGIMILQGILIFGLSGTHVFSHDYYLMGAAPTAVLILGLLLHHFRQRWLQMIFMLGILIPVVELSLMNLKGFYREPYKSWARLPQECARLKGSHSDLPWDRGYVFRSSFESYPTLGLCFGEMQKSPTGGFGFYYRDDEKSIPADCHKIDESEHILLVECAAC